MKTNYLIFIEEHDEKFKITPIVKEKLNLEGKIAVLTENRIYSKQNKALQLYASLLKQKKKVKKKKIVDMARNSQDRFRQCLERQLELVKFTANTGLDFEVIPLDVRYSKVLYKQFKKEDTIFKNLLKQFPKLTKRELSFFEEHAINAWYTQKRINELEKQGFKSFVYSVGYSHGPSLECYLKDKNCEFIPLLNIPPSATFHWRMDAFFLPENPPQYCFHCGKGLIKNS